MLPGERLNLTCRDVDADGAGICATDSAAPDGAAPSVHVPGALPGESVVATVEHVSSHRPQAWASLDQVVTPAAERRAPVCRAFGACGGCVLQHWQVQAQLGWKTGRVGAAFGQHERLGGVPILPCVASPRTLGYRNSAKLVAARAAEGGLRLGAFAPRSHDVVDLRGCAIVEAPLDDVTVALRDVLEGAGVVAYDERRLTGDLRYAVLRVNFEGAVLVTLVTARPDWPVGRAVAAALRARCPSVAGVIQNINPTRGNVIYGEDERTLDGVTALTERIGAVKLRLSSRAFFQANRDVAALIYGQIADAVAAAAAQQPVLRLVDVYGGVGGIALTTAPLAGEVVGIESNAGAVGDATAAARESGVVNARFLAGDAAEQLRTLDRADVMVLNPPRRGCAPAVLTEVLRLHPRLVVYLSCDPETLARDLAHLCGSNYRVRSVTPFDMLPHTPHIEALALLDSTDDASERASRAGPRNGRRGSAAPAPT